MATTELDRQAEAVAKTKALAEAVKRDMGDMVAPHNPHMLKANPRLRRKPSFTIPDYHGLDGEWFTYYKVAQAYVGKVPTQDRDDIRHDIMLELDKATKRDGKLLPELRAYRIASLMVALYWRLRLKREVKVCVYNGVATEPKCASCRHKPKAQRCPYLAIRPVQSLDQPTTDYDGYECRLLDTVADDNALQAIDIDTKVDASLCLLGLPLRLIEIATKRQDGIPLTKYEQLYLCRFWKRTQKRLL